MASNQTTTFYAEIIDETKKAVLCADGLNKFWIPIYYRNGEEMTTMRQVSGSNYEITIPTWLAKQKGVI